MADGMYISMNGAAARAAQLESVADNLANAQTPGFQASRPVFQTFLSKAAEDATPEAGTAESWHPAAVATSIDRRPGTTVTTGNPTDVVPENGAYLSVSLPDGSLAYTRAGRLVVDAEGQLTVAGRPVLDVSGQPLVVPPGSPFQVGAFGEVSSNGAELGRLALFDLPGELSRLGESLVTVSGEAQALPVEARLRRGELELSNVNSLDSAVQMIAAQRHFESSMQAVQTYKRLDERANELGRVR